MTSSLIFLLLFFIHESISRDNIPLSSIERSRLKEATVSISKLVEDTIANRVKEAKNELSDILLKSINFYIKDVGQSYFVNKTCVDEIKDCQALKSEGLCQSSKNVMMKKCKKTCNFCNNDEVMGVDLMNLVSESTDISKQAEDPIKNNDKDINNDISHNIVEENTDKTTQLKHKKKHLMNRKKTRVDKHLKHRKSHKKQTINSQNHRNGRLKRKIKNKQSITKKKLKKRKVKSHKTFNNKRVKRKPSSKKMVDLTNKDLVRENNLLTLKKTIPLNNQKQNGKIAELFENTSKFLLDHKPSINSQTKNSINNPTEINNHNSQPQKILSLGKVDIIPNDIKLDFPELPKLPPIDPLMNILKCPLFCSNQCLPSCPKACCSHVNTMVPTNYMESAKQPFCSFECTNSNCMNEGCHSSCCKDGFNHLLDIGDNLQSKDSNHQSIDFMSNAPLKNPLCPDICQQNCLPSLCLPTCCTSSNPFKYSVIPTNELTPTTTSSSTTTAAPPSHNIKNALIDEDKDKYENDSFISTTTTQSLFCLEHCQKSCDDTCMKNKCCLD